MQTIMQQSDWCKIHTQMPWSDWYEIHTTLHANIVVFSFKKYLKNLSKELVWNYNIEEQNEYEVILILYLSYGNLATFVHWKIKKWVVNSESHF